MADYIHAGVFVPVLNNTEDVAQFTFSPSGNPTAQIRYWDEQAYVSELVVSAAPPSGTDQAVQSQNEARAATGSARPGKDGEPKAKKRKLDSKDTNKQKTVKSM